MIIIIVVIIPPITTISPLITHPSLDFSATVGNVMTNVVNVTEGVVFIGIFVTKFFVLGVIIVVVVVGGGGGCGFGVVGEVG